MQCSGNVNCDLNQKGRSWRGGLSPKDPEQLPERLSAGGRHQHSRTAGSWGYTTRQPEFRKRLSTMQESRVRSLGWEDPLEKEMAIHSSTKAWKIPWTEESGRLQSTGSQKVRHDWATSLSLFTLPLSSCMTLEVFNLLCLFSHLYNENTTHFVGLIYIRTKWINVSRARKTVPGKQ